MAFQPPPISFFGMPSGQMLRYPGTIQEADSWSNEEKEQAMGSRLRESNFEELKHRTVKAGWSVILMSKKSSPV